MANSPIAYFGGKSRLAPTIIKQIPKHTCYVEPFAGAAWVFFKKPPSRVEVLNDRDDNIVNIYRVIQHHPEEFLRQFKTLLISRKIFELMKRHDDECLTDIHRAVKWFYILRASFGGHGVGANFGYGTSRPSNLNVTDLEPRILEIHWRLAKVTIEALPYQQILDRYDRQHTFFYIDPPYWGFKAYRFNFEAKDFAELAAELKQIKGKFLMSLNDCKEVRAALAGFKIETVAARYSVAGGMDRGGRSELLIRNY